MSTNVTAAQDKAFVPSIPEREPALPFRSDTILGVCEAVGQDLGFHPNWLRVPFAALILWNPVVIIASYLLLGVVVAVTRWFFPAQPKAPAAKIDHAPPRSGAAVTVKTEEEELLAA